MKGIMINDPAETVPETVSSVRQRVHVDRLVAVITAGAAKRTAGR
jgi:hypothetical protein